MNCKTGGIVCLIIFTGIVLLGSGCNQKLTTEKISTTSYETSCIRFNVEDQQTEGGKSYFTVRAANTCENDQVMDCNMYLESVEGKKFTAFYQSGYPGCVGVSVSAWGEQIARFWLPDAAGPDHLKIVNWCHYDPKSNHRDCSPILVV
jgi:hypothetical protein